jgi:putative DNA primase/helicase
MAQEGNGLQDYREEGPIPPTDDPEKFVDGALSAPAYVMDGKDERGNVIPGLFWRPGGDKPPMWLSASFEVLGETRDAHGAEWGFWLRWQDDDRVWHEWFLPWALLNGGRHEIWRELADGGLRVTTWPQARDRLAHYLATRRRERRIRTVPQIGWHVTNAVAAFVLPDKTYGETVTERVRWKNAQRADTPYQIAGDLARWREEIGLRCAGNSRLVLAVSAAFAAPLLYVSGDRGGGYISSAPARSARPLPWTSPAASAAAGKSPGTRKLGARRPTASKPKPRSIATCSLASMRWGRWTRTRPA